MNLNLGCREIIRPDLCIFLDVDIDSCDKRIEKNRLEREIFENKSTQKKIRKRFFEVFEKIGAEENIKIVDAARSISEVSADILNIYHHLKEQ